MKFLKLILILLCFNINVYSQYVNYTQYYSSPLNLNPAMTGLGEFGRAGFIYRNQWPTIDNGYHFVSSWMDYNFFKSNFSLGLNLSNEIDNFSKLSTSHISPSFSYEINLGYKLILKSGLQASFTNSNFNTENLIFYDQLGVNGVVNSTSENLSDFKNKNYLNLAMGLLMYSESLWIGASIHNILEPNISYSSDNLNLERVYSFHAGYSLKNIGIAPSFNFRKVGSFSQLDIGSYFNFDPLSIGLWYRGVPIQKNNSFESIIGSLSLKIKKMNISYSYDYNVSELLGYSGGSHEISLIFLFHFFGKNIPPKNARYLECPVPNF